MGRDWRTMTLGISLCLLCCAGAGCQFGPAALRMGHAQYNEAIRITYTEQLLLNLVRLRYRERPIFLSVNNISTQFQFDRSADLAGTLNENVGAPGKNPDALRLSGRIGYSERPTITFSILEGEDFLTRMLTPISTDHIFLLAESGWKTDRVLRLTVEAMNGLGNARGASGPTPALAPTYAEFLEAAQLLSKLQRDELVYMRYETRPARLSDPVPAQSLNPDTVVAAAKIGAAFRAADDGGGYVLTKAARALVFGFSNQPRSSADVARLRDLLQLAGDQSLFDVSSAAGMPAAGRAEHARTRLTLDTRSLMGVMYYLSNAVRAPARHEQARLVTTTLDADDGRFDWSKVFADLFSVYVSKPRPSGAAVAIRHRGYWFYIRDDDETSKSTLALLAQLFALQAGSVKGSSPVLTLPVGG